MQSKLHNFMQALGYYIALPFIYAIAWLPFPALYAFSNLLRVIVFGIAGYRKKVVFNNLQNAFPEKKRSELLQIQQNFEVWFCDLIVETLKTLTIGPKALKNRVSFEGKDILEAYAKRTQSVILVLGHYGNWEMAGARYSLETAIPQLYVIYHPLQHPFFDGLLYRMRTRHGTKLYSMKDTARSMLQDRTLNTATAFIADQTPSPKRAYWTTFLAQDTPVFFGTEALAKKLDYPIVYISVERPERGRYVMRAETLIEEPNAHDYGQITEKHTQRLEQDIRNCPDIWLWTHRRWKHTRPSSA